MKRLFLFLFAAGLTTTVAFAQSTLTSSEPVSITIDVSKVLFLNITGGNAINFVYNEASDYESIQAILAATDFQVRTNVSSYNVTALADAPYLTDASTGATISVNLISLSLAGVSAPQPLSNSVPVSLVTNASAPDASYSIDWYSNLPLGTAPGAYVGGVTITATEL